LSPALATVEHVFDSLQAAVERGAAVAGLPPGPELYQLIASLDPAGDAHPFVTQAVVEGCERLISSLQALSLRWTAAWQRENASMAPFRDPPTQATTLAGILGVSDWEAGTRLAVADAFETTLTRTGAALASGDVPWAKARAIGMELVGLPAAEAARAEGELLEMAEWAGPRKLQREARRMAAAVRGVTEPAVTREDSRYLAFGSPNEASWPADYVSIQGILPPEPGALLMAAVDRLAGRWRADDGRRIETRRADALVELARRFADTEPPRGPGSRAALNVVVSLETLQGAPQPAELNGWMLPAESARRIACDPASITRLVADPMSGRLLDLGRTRREPTARLRRFICERDQHCQFPGCTRPAEGCDVHHAIYWSAGGTTDPVNCFLLCPRHHTHVHELGWTATRTPDGRTRWTDPAGRAYRTEPPPLLPRIYDPAHRPGRRPGRPGRRRDVPCGVGVPGG
jgi:hypothetical protein